MPDKLPAYLAPTFAERRAAREAENKAEPDVKAVEADDENAENKAVAPKATTRKRASVKKS